MTNEELRVKCNELAGWEKKYGTPADRDALIPGLQVVYFKNDLMGIKWRAKPPPDYPSDLNACAELRASLSGEERSRFGLELASLVITGCEIDSGDDWFSINNAIAEQICRAYLKTKNITL